VYSIGLLSHQSLFDILKMLRRALFAATLVALFSGCTAWFNMAAVPFVQFGVVQLVEWLYKDGQEDQTFSRRCGIGSQSASGLLVENSFSTSFFGTCGHHVRIVTNRCRASASSWASFSAEPDFIQAVYHVLTENS
jgi:hypothetical protein